MEDQIYHALTKGVHKPTKHKFALFLCGASGTGKTTTRNMFIKDAGLSSTFVTLNLDDVWALSDKKSDTRKMYKGIVERTIGDGYSFIYDGTCRNSEYIQELMRKVKRKGYSVKVGIVYADLDIVLDRIETRRHLQPISDDLAIKIYNKVSRIANQFMESDEVYLYNNNQTTTLIYSKTKQGIQCIHPNAKFYFNVKDFC
jgi:predicted ABC-type ATPase